MKTNKRQTDIIATFLSLFVAFIFWLVLAPTQLGGQVTYVIIDGNSMEPVFHLGDLVLVRTQPVYQIGDAVTYQNAEMERFVFHRIIALDLDRFVLKGDHNTWLDTHHPNQSEIVGKLWIHIPTLGKAIEWTRSPFNAAIIAGLLGGLLMAGMLVQPPQRGKRKWNPSGNFGGLTEIILYVLGFIALIFLGLTIFSFTRPLTLPEDNIKYQQEGYFFYSAAGTPGVYDTDKVRSGEPIFPKLTCFLNMGFAYNLLSPQLQGISGSYLLYARVMDDQSGWQRTLPISPETAFIANSYFTMGTLDLCQVESIVNAMEQQTGLHPNTYSLSIIAHVAVTAQSAGATITDTFDPDLVFKFDKAHFYLASDSSQTDPLHIIKPGLAVNPNSQTNTVPIFGLQFTVLSVRVFALLGLGLSLGGLLFAASFFLGNARRNEETLIRLKHGALLVDVSDYSFDPASPIIDVTSIDNLVKLAERQGTMILHTKLNFLNYYLVQSDGVTYRYVLSSGTQGALEPEPVRDEITEHLVNAEENRITQSEHAVEEIPVFMIEEEKSQPVETGPAPKEEIMEEKVEPEESQLNGGEATGQEIEAELVNEVEHKPKPIKRPVIYSDEEIPAEETPPVQKEMLRYIFGPYKNNDPDDEKRGK